MRAFFRAGFIAALATLVSFSAIAAEKPFQRDDLADAAIKLEGQIKQDAGTVAKPVATLLREAAASPRACFQFSEELPGKRTDFSPFVALAGQDKPALSAEEKQLCVEGLRHGERYSITLRAGLPSVVKESLSKSADFTIYVRDRKPLVRFTGKAYVLPRTGQRGIPLVSVNTEAVKVWVYRIGDRNLINTVLES